MPAASLSPGADAVPAPGATIFGCAGTHLTEAERAFFRRADPWGFILFARNLEAPKQIRRLAADLRLSVGRNAPILIDQEGGRVARLTGPEWRDWLPPLDQVQLAGPETAARSMYLRYRLIAAELLELGIDVNCAPCADVAGPDTHPFLRNRCYGTDPGSVTAISRAVATGLLAGGVLPVLKHIPGHGRGTVDSHERLPMVAASPEDLMTTDFAPFMALADLPLGMTAHVVYAAYAPEAATVSERMIGLVRREIGFDGLLMTDDISMEALGGPVEKRSAAALVAGCDVVLHCNGEMAEMEAVADVSGRMSAATAARADRAVALRTTPQSIDIPAAEAELEALLAG